MPYRRTENVARRLAEREQAIVEAARSAARAGGMSAVQIAAIAERAGIASGTIYRYFPSKSELVSELIATVAEPEIERVRIDFRKGLIAELEARIGAAVSHGHLPEQDLAIAAPAVVGALLEGLIGPLAPDLNDPARRREAMQNATLVALRALG